MKYRRRIVVVAAAIVTLAARLAVSGSEFYAAAPKAGVVRFKVDAAGNPVETGRVPCPAHYLISSGDGARIYVAGGKRLRVFAVTPKGAPRELGSVPSGGKTTCHLALDRSERWLYAANYSSGDITEVALDQSGLPLPPARLIKMTGVPPGPHPKRQGRSHPHCVVPTPDGKYLLVSDLGLDAVAVLPIAEHGVDPDQIRWVKMPPGSGPRHLAFAKVGDCGVLVSELDNRLFRFTWKNGHLDIDTEHAVSSLLPGNKGGTASAVRFSPDQRFVLVGNRGENTVAVFTFPELKHVQSVPSGGDRPWDLNFTSEGRCVAVANQRGNSVVLFGYDKATGRLTPAGKTQIEGPTGILGIPTVIAGHGSSKASM